jgi:hypothetical protein
MEEQVEPHSAEQYRVGKGAKEFKTRPERRVVKTKTMHIS